DANGTGPEGSTLLEDACLKGHAAIAELLLSHGARVNDMGKAGATALPNAALGGNAATVRLLLEHGADVNARDRESGETPLYYAANLRRVDADVILLQNGAIPDLHNTKGNTALTAAIENTQPDVA